MPDDFKIERTIRINNTELLSYIEDIRKSKVFRSDNAIISKAVELGIPILYQNLFGKKLKTIGSLDTERGKEYDELVAKKLKEINLTIDDVFIVMNVLEYLTATIYNIELSKLNGLNITDDEVRSGLLSVLPDNLQRVKDEVINRHIKKSRN